MTIDKILNQKFLFSQLKFPLRNREKGNLILLRFLEVKRIKYTVFEFFPVTYFSGKSRKQFLQKDFHKVLLCKVHILQEILHNSQISSLTVSSVHLQSGQFT